MGLMRRADCKRKKVKNSASNYNLVRPLETAERQNFYSHMKLMMIDTALKMWYHIHIARDLPIAVVKRHAGILIPFRGLR